MSVERVPFEADPEEGVHVTGFVERDSEGVPVITSLTVTCTTEHHMGRLLRRLKLSEMAQPAAALLPPTTAYIAPTGPATGGRSMLSDDLMRQVAEAYMRQAAPGQPPGAMGRLAAEFGRPEETMRTWVARARARGWLGPSKRGRRGAEPGPRFTA
jgi:hypothetical protein